MACNCKQKKQTTVTEKLGEYTYQELEQVYTLITTKPKMTTEESDQVWELYNRVYYTDKLVNRRSQEQAGKVGRNLIKLYETERYKRQQEEADGQTKGTERKETKSRSTTRAKKTRSKKNT